jgi:phospholipid transport system substrate-binding protein
VPGLVLALLVFPPWAVAGGQQPVDVIRNATGEVLRALQATPATRDDPGRLNAVIRDYILPHVDLETLSRLTLGKNWRQATPEQRSRFAREFGALLVRTYSTALAGYTGQNVDYLSSDIAADGRRATVRTRVLEDGLAPLAVDYSLRRAGNSWKVYDVTIEGVSLAVNYRTSFAQEIRDHGIDGLIERLATRNSETLSG